MIIKLNIFICQFKFVFKFKLINTADFKLKRRCQTEDALLS